MSIPEHLFPYAGRWVALTRDDVVGVGATADEARASAQLSRPKETPRVFFVPEPFEFEWPDLLRPVMSALPAEMLPRVWLVGGAVRDVMLNRRVHDMDFAVDGDGLALARKAANSLGAAFYALDADRSVGRVVWPSDDHIVTLDFARLRGADIYADLAARDFTINALAVPLDAPQTLLDPLRGQADLRAKIIRACAPAAIADDPVRALRAVRQAAQLAFRIEPATRAQIKSHALALTATSAERQRDELIRCLGGPRPAAALRALEALGPLQHLLPEVLSLKGVTQSPPHVLDVWEHTLATLTRLDEIITLLGPVHDVDFASDVILGLVSVQLGRYRQLLSEHLRRPLSSDRPARWTLMLAALLHDAGKPRTRSVEADGRIRFISHEAVSASMTEAVMQRLRFSTDEIRYAQTIVANHMRPRQLSRLGLPSARAIYKYFRDTGAAGVEIVLLSLADYLAKFGGSPPPQEEWAGHLAACAKLLEAYFEKREAHVTPPVLLNGDDLMREFGLAPGPALGALLEAVREAQAAGEVTDRTGALEFVRRTLPHARPDGGA